MLLLLQNHPFCRFCDLIKQQTDNALNLLRNHHDLNISLLLFCYWFAVNQQGLLSKMQIKKLLASTHSWHQKIVSPLQEICKQLQKSVHTGYSTLEESGCEEANNLLSTTEQVELELIADLLPKKVKRNRPALQQIVTHACLNVFTYLQTVYISLNDVDYINLNVITKAIFPDMEDAKIISLIRSSSIEKQAKGPLQKNLLFVFS